MNAKAEKTVVHSTSGGLDVVLLVLAALIALGGIVAYYYFSDWNMWARLGLLVAGFLAGAGVASFTGVGRSVRNYLSESRFEMRKVVWPTREETLRTTLVVVIVVIILSLLLGLIDVILKWVVIDHLLKPGR